MSDKLKNIISLLLAILIVGFFLFALMYWVFGLSVNSSLDAAIAGTLAGSIGPYLGKYLKKIMEKKLINKTPL